MLRTTLTDETPADITHKNMTDKEAAKLMAAAKKTWLLDYQMEREVKRDFIRKNVLAQGIDLSKLLQRM